MHSKLFVGEKKFTRPEKALNKIIFRGVTQISDTSINIETFVQID